MKDELGTDSCSQDEHLDNGEETEHASPSKVPGLGTGDNVLLIVVMDRKSIKKKLQKSIKLHLLLLQLASKLQPRVPPNYISSYTHFKQIPTSNQRIFGIKAPIPFLRLRFEEKSNNTYRRLQSNNLNSVKQIWIYGEVETDKSRRNPRNFLEITVPKMNFTEKREVGITD